MTHPDSQQTLSPRDRVRRTRVSILVRASPASATSDCNLLPKRECLYPAKSCSCSITHRDEARIFGKLTEAVLGIKCLHPLQIGPRCFPAVMWMAVQQWRCIYCPWASHSAALLQGLPAPQAEATNPFSKWERSKWGLLSCP